VSHQRRAAIAILALVFLAVTPSASAAEVTIAVVRDGPGPEDRLVGLIEQELANHTPPSVLS